MRINQPQEQKSSKYKNLIAAIGIEGIFIVVALLVIFGILSYLNIVPLSKFLTFLPSAGKPNTVAKSVPGKKGFRDPNYPVASPTINLNVPKSVTAVSEFPGYTVTIKNKQELIALLASWEVYGRPFSGTSEEGNTKAVPISSIVLTLTPKPQKGNLVSSPGTGVYLSSGILATEKQVNILVFVSPQILADKTKNAGNYFQVEAFTAAYNMAHPANSAEEYTKRQNEIVDILNTLRSQNKSLFEIKKL